MIKNIYSIRDKFTGYMAPMVEDNDYTAMRNITHAMKSDVMCGLNAKPSDFTLNYLGTFDTETGEIKTVQLKIVCEISDLIINEV